MPEHSIASITPGSTTSDAIVVGHGAISRHTSGISQRYDAGSAGMWQTRSVHITNAASTSRSRSMSTIAYSPGPEPRVAPCKVGTERVAAQVGCDLVKTRRAPIENFVWLLSSFMRFNAASTFLCLPYDEPTPSPAQIAPKLQAFIISIPEGATPHCRIRVCEFYPKAPANKIFIL